MPTIVKLIITIVVALFIGFVFGSDKNVVPHWIAPFFACAVLALWLMKDPNEKKKQISFQKQQRKRKIENIFLLTIIALIIIMVILKFPFL
jgi:uncharacterized membrane protein